MRCNGGSHMLLGDVDTLVELVEGGGEGIEVGG